MRGNSAPAHFIMIRSERRYPPPSAPNVSSEEEYESTKRTGHIEMRQIDGPEDSKKHPDFLRLDHYEIDNDEELIVDDEFFKGHRTPSRSSISPAAKSDRIQQVGLDKTPIMLMKQMNRLSVNYF
jgi:hypothetical protein